VTLRLVVITGPPGVGKSTTAVALSDLLAQREIAHALIDMDHLRWNIPAPEGDPRNVQLGLKHLGWLVGSYREARATLLIVVDVVPTENPHGMFESVIPDSTASIVRLRLPLDVIHKRITRREPEGQHDWYMDKAELVAGAYDEFQVGDIVVDCDDRTADDIAREIVERLGPIQSVPGQARHLRD
jgi:adenylylsulfate kinase-like enzyme